MVDSMFKPTNAATVPLNSEITAKMTSMHLL